MITTLRFDRYSLDAELRDTSKWCTVNRTQLSETQLIRYERLEQIVIDYLAGRPVKDICAQYAISRVEIVRITKRCLALHADGFIWGFRALISYTHQKGYQRLSSVKPNPSGANGGAAGALTQLFDRFPTVRELVVTLFLKKPKEGIVHESRIPLKSIHKRFLKACREVGLTAKDYPFSQLYLGRTALFNFLKSLENSRTKETALARYADGIAKKLASIDSPPPPERILRPLQVVEFDGHRVDLSCTLLIPSVFGGFIKKTIEHFWVLPIMDVLTRSILGYSISLRREYSQDDVLRCAKNAVTPWQPKQSLTIDGLKYLPEGGFPSQVYPKLQWAVFDEFKYDNAKSHLADKTLKRLCQTLGCATNPGPIADPNKRRFIERLFLTFEENGFHRSPSTTGSSPRDPRRKNPEKFALQHDIMLSEIEDLIDVMFADYNGTPHEGIGYRSPLEYLGFLLQDEVKVSSIRILPEAKHNNLHFLNLETSRVVEGNPKQGKRPYIQFENVRYQNNVLARSPELIGKRLTLSIDPDDPRSLEAFLPNGARLGVLTGRGVWGRTPHNLESRRAIFQLRRKKLIHYTENDDPMQVYTDHLARKAQKSKAAARQFVSAQRAIQTSRSKTRESQSQSPIKRSLTTPNNVKDLECLGKGFVF